MRSQVLDRGQKCSQALRTGARSTPKHCGQGPEACPSRMHAYRCLYDRSLIVAIIGTYKSTHIFLTFLKIKDSNPFYILPVVSAPLFPQFKGVRPLSVTRAKQQKGSRAFLLRRILALLWRKLGRMSLNPGMFFSRSLHRYLLTRACKDSAPSGGDNANPHITFGNLFDPSGRYSSLKENAAYRRYQMCVPQVFDVDNNLVKPSQYKDAIPDGTLVTVRGKLKM